jgi:hypothetical protein
MNLYQKYMSSAAFYRDANNDQGTKEPEKTPAQIAQAQRESIQVISSDPDEKKEGENDDTTQEDSEDNGDADDDDKGENKDDDDKDDKENETDEQKQARLAQEKEERKQARQQRKWDRLAAEKTAAENRVKELEAQLKEQPKEGLTEEEVERRAKEKAEKALREKEALDIEADFDKRNETIYNAAVKHDKEFDKNIQDLVQEVGLIPRPMVYVLSDLDHKNGHEVMTYLANPDNIEEAEEIFKMTPHKMALKLVRLSDKLQAEKKPPPKKPSAAPNPVERVTEGNNRQRNVLPANPTKDIEDFVRIRNQQERERRENRGR